LETFKSFALKIYQSNARPFEDIAMEIFHFQVNHNPLYAAYVQNLGIDSKAIRRTEQIPYMPISFFKGHTIQTGGWEPEMFFTSSGTTGAVNSRHAVMDLSFYLEHSRKCFEFFLGDLRNYHFLALLPSYLERTGSSLIAMMEYFIRNSESPASGFYLHNQEQLVQDVEKLRNDNRKTILWGVSFALLDLVEKFHPDFGHCMVFETGGMKGRRKEITRMELHDTLRKGLGVNKIYSEYGMTELFSQAYTDGGDRFKTPPWMRVVGRDVTDPLTKGLLGETAGINVIDLANWSTISFLETEDLGKIYGDGTFEVMGRMDNSDVRGCNLLIG
jgi:hypothetical protein